MKPAVERIEAAIESLEAQKAASTPGPWQVDLYPFWDDVAYGAVSQRYWVFSDAIEEDAQLIVTLHRTIDAQLAILRFAIEQNRTAGFDYLDHDPEVLLADAILGSDHADHPGT